MLANQYNVIFFSRGHGNCSDWLRSICDLPNATLIGCQWLPGPKPRRLPFHSIKTYPPRRWGRTRRRNSLPLFYLKENGKRGKIILYRCFRATKSGYFHAKKKVIRIGEVRVLNHFDLPRNEPFISFYGIGIVLLRRWLAVVQCLLCLLPPILQKHIICVSISCTYVVYIKSIHCRI